nr:MAG TPA: hypothetical protein [Caudoviricetes sp.]
MLPTRTSPRGDGLNDSITFDDTTKSEDLQ